MTHKFKRLASSVVIASAMSPLYAQADFHSVSPSNATYVRSGNYVDVNYDNDDLKIKNCIDANLDRKAFLKFVFPTGLGTNIQSAQLHLYSNDYSESLNVHEVSSNWGESTITWSNAPSAVSEVGQSSLRNDKYTVIDVTDYVQAKVDASAPSASFQLSDDEANCGMATLHDESNTNIPKLVIVDESSLAANQSYYVDSVNGDDSNDGTTDALAWKTLDRVNRATVAAGTKILFKAGQTHEGNFMINGAGSAASPAVIGKYGTGDDPHIEGNGMKATIHLLDAENITIENLEVTNYNPDEESGKSLSAWEAANITDWFNVSEPPQLAAGDRPYKFGIIVEANDQGSVDNILLKGLEVHGVNGAIDQAISDTKNNGGIMFKAGGTTTPTYFNSLIVEDSHIHNVDRTGLYNVSTWDNIQSDYSQPWDWAPSLGYIVRNNTFEYAGANAVIMRASKNAIFENNTLYANGIKGSGNAMFIFSSEGALIQHNHASYTKRNTNDVDAGGLDSDYRTMDTIIQYNYLYRNDYGMLVTGGPHSSSFNNDTIVRYNVFDKDGYKKNPDNKRYFFKVSGRAKRTQVHNNVFYSTSSSDIYLAYHKTWTHTPHDTNYYNNIYHVSGPGTGYDLNNSSGNDFNANIWHGSSYTWPTYTDNSEVDPQFVMTGTEADRFKVLSTSPALGGGMTTPPQWSATVDYFGDSVPSSEASIGIDEND